MDTQRFLIGLGLAILIAGLAWPLLTRIGIGRLGRHCDPAWQYGLLFSDHDLHSYQPRAERIDVVVQSLSRTN